MTTFAFGLANPDTEQRERFFFFAISVAVSVTVLIGFGSFAVLGISSVYSPWWVHIHAVSFMAWIGLYLMQNFHVLRNHIDQHRRLGKIGVALALWITLVGVTATVLTIATGRIPPLPIFTPAFFLALSWVNIACFAALVYAALRFRKQTDWHRRLMLCATICVIAPAWGRLLNLAGAMSEWNNIGTLLVYVAIAMLADWRIRGRVHSAYFWGFGAIFAQAPVIAALSAFSPFQEFAMRIAG